jgi:UDP-2,3-diacylglucosamine hydrolase
MLDALARRNSGFSRSGVLAKISKPGQELRADLPAIGPDTVEQAAAAGLAGIVVEAGKALILDRDLVIARANGLGMFIAGVRGFDP